MPDEEEEVGVGEHDGSVHMYGMVNKAVEEMVCRQHGPAVWEQIRARAAVDVEVFISNECYADQITHDLITAASEVLRVPAEQVLHGLGEHWVLHTAQENYRGLMQAAGKTLPEFLRNLPNFHCLVAMIFPNLEPPRFECMEVTDCSLKLHYRSHRQGLAPFVAGALSGLGKMFGTPVNVRWVEARAEAADPEVLEVTWTPSPAT